MAQGKPTGSMMGLQFCQPPLSGLSGSLANIQLFISAAIRSPRRCVMRSRRLRDRCLILSSRASFWGGVDVLGVTVVCQTFC
eukprot:8765925-Pyramimonas_sp.AAC.1